MMNSIFLFLVFLGSVFAQGNRTIPPIPPIDKPVQVIIDTDARNEIDDQWAVTLAILRLDRLTIEGFVTTTYSETPMVEKIDSSYRELLFVLELAEATDRWPVYKGSMPLPSMTTYNESPGVDFIIERARAHTPEDPIWIVLLGAPTNMASAFLKAPDIKNNVVVFWHGRSGWPTECKNYNAKGDRFAARLLFESGMPFILFDTGTDLVCPMPESEVQVKPYGALGNYLHEFRYNQPFMQSDTKGFFDMGDIAAIIDPSVATWEVADCPTVTEDMLYDFTNLHGKLLRCKAIDRDKTFNLFYERLHATNGIVAPLAGKAPN